MYMLYQYKTYHRKPPIAIIRSNTMDTQGLDKSIWGGAKVFDTLLADIRMRSAEFEQQRHISHDIIERFKHIGVYRALVPACYGGDEKTPVQFLQMVEAISQADGSAGWVASFGMNPAYLSSLPAETIKKVWQNGPDVVFAGGVFPPQKAEYADNCYTVSGRWPFGSGCMSAELIGVGIVSPDALPCMAVMPRSAVKIQENWDVIGMVGTGSHDIVVDSVKVPEEWTFIRGSSPNIDAPFFRYPSLSFATQVLAVTTLGLAQEALRVLQQTAKGRTSVTGAPNLGERAYAQIDMAKAEAKVRSSKVWFYKTIENAWEQIQTGDKPTPEQVNMLRLSATNLTHECAEAVRICYQMSGMTGAYNTHPLSRIYRDVAMCTQHAFMGAVTYQNAGAMLFGHTPLPGYL